MISILDWITKITIIFYNKYTTITFTNKNNKLTQSFIESLDSPVVVTEVDGTIVLFTAEASYANISIDQLLKVPVSPLTLSVTLKFQFPVTFSFQLRTVTNLIKSYQLANVVFDDVLPVII